MLFTKKILLLNTVLLFCLTAEAQTAYYGNVPTTTKKLEAFKNTTTLFTLPFSAYKEVDKYEAAIKTNWTITPFKVIKPEELAKYQSLPNYSFFYFDTYTEQLDTIENVNFIYGLRMIFPTEKPKQMEETTFATITLFPDALTNFQLKMINGSGGSRKYVKSKQLSLFYNHANFLNWSPGLLAGYLKQINDGLALKQTRTLDYQFYNKKRLPELIEETLYIPEYVREIFSAQPVNLAQMPDDERYRYKFKFVTEAVLDSLILNKESNIKYLVYTKRTNDKIISIYDSKDGLLIYQMFSFQSPNFSMTDLNNIKKTIKEIAD